MPPMPAPPQVGLFTRYVLENPYPATVILLAFAIIMGWTALRDGRLDRLKAAVIPGLAGIAVLAAGLLITTAGEHGKTVIREFVEAVVEEDIVGASEMLSDDATMALGSPTSPSFDLDYILDRLDSVISRYEIASNRITKLRGYGIESGRAEVHLACVTEVADGWAPTPSRWVLEVERQEDGTWKVDRITCISINNQIPNTNWLR